MRSYGQYCSIARGLDVVGDRWTLLIVRELLLQGPCRFTDLRNGLPGIAANLLSSRLRELEQAELISREDAPPPVATTLYGLTESGRALEPALKALGIWGLRYMAEDRPDDAFQAHWLAYGAAWLATDTDPEAPPVTIQVQADGKPVVVEIVGGRVESRVGRTEDPDLEIDGPPRAVLGLLNGLLDLDGAEKLGVSARGRTDVLSRLRPASTEAGPVDLVER